MQRYIPTVSSEATRTPLRAESWMVAWLEFFFRPPSELFLNVVNGDGGTTCLAGNGEDRRNGLVAGWPRTSQRITRAMVMSGPKGCEVWYGRYRQRAYFFMVAAGLQRSPKTTRGRGRWSNPMVAMRGSRMVSPWGDDDVIVAAERDGRVTSRRRTVVAPKGWGPTVWRIERGGENNKKSLGYPPAKLGIATKRIEQQLPPILGSLPSQFWWFRGYDHGSGTEKR
jgi:hypothetical protein